METAEVVDATPAAQTTAVPSRIVSPKVAQHALWHLGDNDGWAVQPGMFEQRLFGLIDTADEDNLAKLELVFPEHVKALVGGRKSWGINWLRSCTEAVAS